MTASASRGLANSATSYLRTFPTLPPKSFDLLLRFTMPEGAIVELAGLAILLQFYYQSVIPTT